MAAKAPFDLAQLLRERLQQPHRLLRQLVVGEALAERPRRGLVSRATPPPPPAAPPAEPEERD